MVRFHQKNLSIGWTGDGHSDLRFLWNLLFRVRLVDDVVTKCCYMVFAALHIFERTPSHEVV